MTFPIHAQSGPHLPPFALLDSSGILQILSGMSWDTLLLLFGLAFIAVAVVGNISGKITPGKEGRIAAAILGVCLMAGGIWYHSVLHSFKVTGLDVTSPESQSGKCPLTIPLQAVADAKGAGDIIYDFEFSTGNASALQHATFSQTGSQILSGTWEVHGSVPDAWIRLNIAAPTKLVSQPSTHFSITCDAPPPPDASAEAAPPPSPATPASDSPPTPVTQPPPPSPAPPAAQPAAPPPASTPEQTKVPGHKLAPNADSVAFDLVNPPSGTYLKRGAPIPFNIVLTYNLVSANSAILSVSTAQMKASPASCAGGGELSDAVQVPIQRGTHQTSLRLIWSGDTGLATKGRVYGNGFVSFTPMFWATNNGQRGARIDYFGVYPEYCYRFGP